MCYVTQMTHETLQSHRRARLKAAVERMTGGNVAAFGRLVGYRDGAFVRQMISGARVVSEKTVHSVEELAGMQGWFAIGEAGGHRVAEPAVAVYRVSSRNAPALLAVPAVVLTLEIGRTDFTCVAEAQEAGGGDASGAVFPHAWLHHHGFAPSNLFAVRVGDDSMQPSLHRHDLLTVNVQMTEPVDGQVYLVNDEGVCRIRRIVRDKGCWWLTADNPLRHPRKELLAPYVLVIGRGVHLDSGVI